MRIVNEEGKPVGPDDPTRVIWCPAGGCGYWTDDWDKLGAILGIPCCPVCGAVGFIISAEKWLGESLDQYDLTQPGYKRFLTKSKETCFAKSGGFLAAFRRVVSSQ